MSATSYVAVGRPSLDPSMALCSRAAGSSFSPASLEGAQHAWVSRCRIVRASMDDIEMELEWERWDARAGGLVRTLGDRRRIRLRENEYHLLDFVDNPQAGGTCARNLVVGIRPSITEDPALADRVLEYELWFVDEAPDGTRILRREQARAEQGERIAVAFEPLRWPVRGARFADGSRAEVLAEISAEILGRVRRDGGVALVLGVGRRLGVVPEAQERLSGYIGDGGRKVFRAGLGENVALALPPPQGSHVAWSPEFSATGIFVGDEEPSPSPPPGVAEEGRGVRVEFPEFFRGHTMRLIVTVTAD